MDRVSSAYVKLNSVQVVGSDDLNQQVASVTREDLTLYANNTIEVEVRGKPGSYITVEIRKEPLNVNVDNTLRDLSGRNMKTQTVLWWEGDERAHEYVIYKAYSIDGPWIELGRVPLTNAVDINPEAQTRDLCYKIEALDSNSVVIRQYEPICVPKWQEEESSLPLTQKKINTYKLSKGGSANPFFKKGRWDASSRPPFQYAVSSAPDNANMNQPTTVTFSALIRSESTPSSVNLKQYDEKYHYIADLGILYDDGIHTDRKSGDVAINETSPKTLNYRVAALYQKSGGMLKKVFSDFFSIRIINIPSITGVITPQGGTITLQGYATVTFPKGAFAANQNITVSATSSPETQRDYNELVQTVRAGPQRLPYEIRINTGSVAPVTSVDAVLYVPTTFFYSLPQNAEIEVFADMTYSTPNELLGGLEGLSSDYNSTTKSIKASLPTEVSFQLTANGTYEAIVLVGTYLK